MNVILIITHIIASQLGWWLHATRNEHQKSKKLVENLQIQELLQAL